MPKINWQYAIGEIIIVIIGISIAFALNNWKDSRSDQRLKKEYLENLMLDIDAEIIHLEENQKVIGEKLGLIREVQPFLGQAGGRRDSIVSKIFKIANVVTFTPENTTYLTLVNSGDLKLIDNFTLRRNIEAHYSFHKQVENDYYRITSIYERYLGEFFVRDIDYGQLRKGNASFLDKPLLRNILNSIQGSYYILLNTNKKGLESNQNLLNELKAELEK